MPGRTVVGDTVSVSLSLGCTVVGLTVGLLEVVELCIVVVVPPPPPPPPPPPGVVVELVLVGVVELVLVAVVELVLVAVVGTVVVAVVVVTPAQLETVSFVESSIEPV